MKKLVLIVSVICMSSVLFAQKPANVYKALKMPDQNSIYNFADKVVLPSYGPVKFPVKSVQEINTVNKIPFSSSYNIFTALVSESNCLTYNPDINTIMFTHRAGGPYGGSGDNIKFSYTSDLGSTFTDVIVTGSSKLLRYPSGVIFNPAGNTNPLNVYAFAMGPSTTTVFDSYYYLDAKLDSTNIYFTYKPDNAAPLPQYFPRYGMAACSDSMIHNMGYFDDGNHASTGEFNMKYLVMNNFAFNNSVIGNFDWTYDTIHVPLFNAPGNGKDVYSRTNSAWSEDGTVGYMWIVGVDSLDPNMATVPLVYKSTDKGATWNAMPSYDFHNNSTIMTNLNNWWQGILGNSGIPRINFVDWFSGSDGVVDANGDLHIFTLIGCGYGTTFDADSLGYIYANEPKIIYDVYTTSTGWDTWVVDTILTDYVKADESGFGSGTDAVGWDHRIQASRTQDGTKLFCVWNDTDTTFSDIVNLPDVIVKGYDINTKYKTPSVNFTINTAYDGDNFFMYVADRAVVQGNDFTVPVVTAAIGGTPDDPPTWELLTGITFNETDFTSGIKTYDAQLSSISQNYPNPFKGSTSFDINLQKPSEISISVSNIMGQEVLSRKEGTMGAGKHTIKLNAENLNPGIYLYTVKAENNSITGKMIVE